MTVEVNPTVQRQRLASELRRFRENARLTIEEVAQALECSESKISRIETGRVRATPRDVRDMLDVFKVTDEQQKVALMELARGSQLARGSRQSVWWRTFIDVPFVPRYADLEAAADYIHSYQAAVVPGLLQTEHYARAVIRGARPDLPARQVERRLQLRMRRQIVLSREDPPLIWAVLDEAVLRRRIGGINTMQEQLHHLVKVAHQDNVTIQVLPFEAGEHPGVDGHFTIFGFRQAAIPEIVYFEHTTLHHYLRKETETRRYIRAFDILHKAALTPDDSIAMITDLAERLESPQM